MDCAFGAVCVQLTKAAAEPSSHPITALVVFPVTLLTLLLLRRSSHKVQAILQCYRLGFRTTEPAVNGGRGQNLERIVGQRLRRERDRRGNGSKKEIPHWDAARAPHIQNPVCSVRATISFCRPTV